MDTPLLALTRQPSGPTLRATPDSYAGNMRQLVQLRWLAVAGQLVTILGVHFGLGIELPLALMLGLVGLLGLANIAIARITRRLRVSQVELCLALLLDMATLTAQLYLSGGATNPFILLLLMQVVLGAILLEGSAVWLFMATATLCYAGLSIQHRPLLFPLGLAHRAAALYTFGAWLGFVLAAVLLVLFIGRISHNLRARNAYLAELRTRAAEEDAIVRMGLFASGAAHELGTPLATLSVILGDWRRDPKLSADADLAGEVEVMLAEVERCKGIVTDILHSAGEPRDEELARIPASAFFAAIVDDWAPTHPSTPLTFQCDTGEEQELIADPALRQALWNLLDNAAEASPDHVAVEVIALGNDLQVSVSDRGPGFSADQLASIGEPYRSTKGAGHGVGLFLAVNVARRLGGRLEARNRDGGGAEVRLLLPLAVQRQIEQTRG